MIHNIEIHELITMLDDFFEDEVAPVFDIGEMVGCNLLRYVAESAVNYVNFNSILFVMGSADAAYAIEKRNVVHWKWLFNDFMVDNIHDMNDPLVSPTFRYNQQEYEQRLIPSTLNGYCIIIINQAQLIPRKYMDMITSTFQGQIVRIYDPFDIMGGFEYVDVPLRCVDTFEKLPMTIAYARSLYGQDTRYVNKRATNKLVCGVNIKRRSVGKIDDAQYVTNDMELLNDCWERQKTVQVRRNQKVLVMNHRLNIVKENVYEHVHSLGDGALLHIVQRGEDDMIRCRIHSSKAEFDVHMTYQFEPFRTPMNALIVQPANVIAPTHCLNNHYFKQIVYVTTPDTPLISIRDQYTLLKQSQNLIIAKTK